MFNTNEHITILDTMNFTSSAIQSKSIYHDFEYYHNFEHNKHPIILNTMNFPPHSPQLKPINTLYGETTCTISSTIHQQIISQTSTKNIIFITQFHDIITLNA